MDDEKIISDRTLDLERQEREQQEHAARLPAEDREQDDPNEPNVPNPAAGMPGEGTGVDVDKEDRIDDLAEKRMTPGTTWNPIDRG